MNEQTYLTLYELLNESFTAKFFDKISKDDYTYFTMAEVCETLDECLIEIEETLSELLEGNEEQA